MAMIYGIVNPVGVDLCPKRHRIAMPGKVRKELISDQRK